VAGVQLAARYGLLRHWRPVFAGASDALDVSEARRLDPGCLPGSAGQEIRALTPEAFVREQQERTSDTVATVVVAGVGSSAVGTAALARGVADYLGTPVAGIVSGLGLADVVSEALGGWVVFGARNALREVVARFLDAFALKDHVRDPETHRELKADVAPPETPNERFLYGEPGFDHAAVPAGEAR
jgi:hypothetical protein